MNINLIMTVAPLIVSAICFVVSFYIFFKHRKYFDTLTSLYHAFAPFAAGIILIISVLLSLDKTEKHSQEQVSVETTPIANSTDDCFIVIPDDCVIINLNKSNSAEFTVFLGNSTSQDDTDGFSFSYLDLNKNEIEKSPIEVTSLKANKKKDCYTATVSAQEIGSYFIRCSHKLATFSTDILVVVTTGEEI